MTPAELKHIQSQIESAKTAMMERFESLAIEVASIGLEQKYGQVSGEIGVGDRVRVYAACADMKGSSYDGQESVVLALPDPERPYAKTITVRLLHKDFDGEEVRVYPQQCERIQPAKKSDARSRSRTHGFTNQKDC